MGAELSKSEPGVRSLFCQPLIELALFRLRAVGRLSAKVIDETERGLQGSDAIPKETDKQLAYTVGVVNKAVSRSASTADMTLG